MRHAGVLTVADFGGAGRIGAEGLDHAAGVFDGNGGVGIAVEGPDGDVAAGFRCEVGNAAAANGERGGEEAGTANEEVPGGVAAHGVAADQDAGAVDGKRGERLVEQFEGGGRVGRGHRGVGVANIAPWGVHPFLVGGALRGEDDGGLVVFHPAEKGAEGNVVGDGDAVGTACTGAVHEEDERELDGRCGGLGGLWLCGGRDVGAIWDGGAVRGGEHGDRSHEVGFGGGNRDFGGGVYRDGCWGDGGWSGRDGDGLLNRGGEGR